MNTIIRKCLALSDTVSQPLTPEDKNRQAKKFSGASRMERQEEQRQEQAKKLRQDAKQTDRQGNDLHTAKVAPNRENSLSLDPTGGVYPLSGRSYLLL